MEKKIVVVSGYFSPLHIGHIRMFKEAKKLGTELWVVVNNDKQVMLKGSCPFMSLIERLEIIASLKMVDEALPCLDYDETVCKTLRFIQPDIFANGGDRKKGNIPEAKICKELGIKMVFGVGGSEKVQASSELIRKAVEWYRMGDGTKKGG